MSDTVFDARDFRRSLSQFPTGVTVITTLDEDGNPVGVTASSFNTVSIEPALVLWSIDKGAHSLKAFQEGKNFVVNVLGRDQVATSNNFASRGEDKFANAQYHAGIGGCPVLDDYAAQFECETWAVYEGGDHLILVGEVKDYRYQDNVEPLVFARGSYAVSSQHPEMVKSATAETDAQSDFVNDYLLYLLRVSYQRFSAQLYPKLQDVCDITPEEWRILARMISRPSITVTELTEMVMQPEVALRQTADWMSEKGFITYEDSNTLAITAKGSDVATKMQELALTEEADLLKQLSDDQGAELKNTLKALLEKLD